MIREVKIPRVDPSVATEAAKWSDDGQIALLAGSHVLIMSPSIVKYRESLDKTNDFYDTTSTQSIDAVPWYLAEIPLVDDQELSVGATSSDHCLTDVEWSPTGMAPNCGCLLAVLTTRHEALVYCPAGNPNTTKWQLAYHLNQTFIDDTLIEPPFFDKDVRKLRFHAISWSSCCHSSSDNKWGTSFLALGTESGDIVIYQNSRSHNMTYCRTFNVTTKWIVGLKFSFWMGNEALLAVTTSDNTVSVLRLRYRQESEDLKILDTFNILPHAGRLQISCLSWYNSPKTKMCLLSIARPSQLLLMPFIDGEPDAVQKVFTNINTSISGMIFNEITSSLINITLASGSGEVFSCQLNSTSSTVIAAGNSFLHQFIVRKLKTPAPNISSLKMEVFACISHKHETYMALLYRMLAPDELRYPIVSQQAARLAFLPMVSYEDPKKIDIKGWPVVSGSGISTWWEIMMLERMCPKEIRKEFYSRVIETLQDEACSSEKMKSGTLKERLENAFYFDTHEDSRRILVELTHKEDQLRILSKIAEIVLESDEAQAEDFNDIDMALLASYSQFYQEPNTFKKFSKKTIRIPGKYFDGDFNFSADSTASLMSIRSQSNHVWKRCSITLLPLNTPHLLTCSGCLRKVLGKQSLESQGITLGPIISVILETLDVCVYCGGRFYQR